MSAAPERVRAVWLEAPASRRVLAALAAGGRATRFVGGCVRDALLRPGADAADLDLATQEPPERVIALLQAEGLRFAPTGLKHGTVTAFAEERSFEITTLRRDVACDGRHAEVEFTCDFVADAARRDFTINTMSCDAAGRLHDPFAGRADLLAGRVRFVGEAARRIAEDHLRILRFFRFQARFGREPADAEALAACAAAADRLALLSGERVRQELFRILMTGRVLAALDLMAATGVLAHLVPWPMAPGWLARLIEPWPEADPLLRLAALTRARLPGPAAIGPLAAGLRLANAEAERLRHLLSEPLPDPSDTPQACRRDLFRLGAELYADLVRLAVAAGQAEASAATTALQAAVTWRPPSLPVTGADLLARGVPPGPGLGRLLAELRLAWEAADFALDRSACLALLDRLIARARS